MGALRASGAVHRMGMEEWIRFGPSPAASAKSRSTALMIVDDTVEPMKLTVSPELGRTKEKR